MKPLIIACTDFSPCSTAALKEAARIAMQDEMRVLLVHAYNPKSVAHWQPQAAIDQGHTWDEPSMRDLKAARAKYFADFSETDVQYDALPDADAAKAISEKAKELQAKLIVIGSHGRTGLARTLLGSVAEHTVRHAPCNVLVVREVSG